MGGQNQDFIDAAIVTYIIFGMIWGISLVAIVDVIPLTITLNSHPSYIADSSALSTMRTTSPKG